MTEFDLRNAELAERLKPVCAAFAVSEKTRIATRFMNPDFVMNDRIASALEPGAADNPALGLEWDEAIGCLDGSALSAAVVEFLRGLFLGTIRDDRLAGSAIVWRIAEGRLSFPLEPDRQGYLCVLAEAFEWLARGDIYSDSDARTLREFAKRLRIDG